MQIDTLPDGVPCVRFLPVKYGRPLDVDGRAEPRWRGLLRGRRHRLDYYEALMIEEGEGTVELDGHELRFQAPSVFVTSPGDTRRVMVREPLKVRFAVFRPAAMSSVSSASIALPSQPRLEPDDVQRVAAVCEAIEDEVQRGRADLPAMLDALLAQLIVLLRRGSTPVRAEIVVRLEALIERHFRQEHHAGAYATALGVSTDHLSALVRRAGQRSAKYMIQRRLIREAGRLLRATTLDIAEIAVELGYDEPAYFARAFRRQTGLTPSAYRLSAS